MIISVHFSPDLSQQQTRAKLGTAMCKGYLFVPLIDYIKRGQSFMVCKVKLMQHYSGGKKFSDTLKFLCVSKGATSLDKQIQMMVYLFVCKKN